MGGTTSMSITLYVALYFIKAIPFNKKGSLGVVTNPGKSIIAMIISLKYRYRYIDYLGVEWIYFQYQTTNNFGNIL